MTGRRRACIAVLSLAVVVAGSFIATHDAASAKSPKPAGAQSQAGKSPALHGEGPRGRAPAAPGAVWQRLHDRARQEGQVRVVVQLRLAADAVPEGTLSPPQVAAQRRDIARVQSEVIKRLRRTGHRVVRRYRTMPYLAVEAKADALAELQASSFYVRQVMEDTLHEMTLWESVPLVEADQAWARGADGSGTVVAVIDTGVDGSHPLLAGKVVREACFSSTVPGVSTSLCPSGAEEQVGAGAAAPCPLFDEGCWHGTHVAGIVAGNGDAAEVPLWGVARGARLMAVQVFSRFDSALHCGGFAPCLGAWNSDVLAALEHVYLVRTQHVFAAVNMSLGGAMSSTPCDDDIQKPIIDHLRSANIATVVASGNDGAPDALRAPACVSSAVSVGATTKTDDVAFFSNVAPFLHLFAPGELIVSSIPGDYAFASGTSMAAPHVAGAWAILKQAAPEATVDEMLAALRQTGVPITDTRASTGITVPRIRVASAVAALLGEVQISSVSPATGTPGSTVDLSIGGINFQPGAAVTVGPDVAVSAVSVVSPVEIVATVTIAAEAALGPRDVTVTNPDGASATRVGAFTVVPPPPTLTLAYAGKVRDRVGRGTTALGADGAPDATFTVRVEPGSGPRTVTGLVLEVTSGRWDTDGASVAWALGAARDLDGALLNGADAAVSFPVADGDVLALFGADLASGTVLTVGATATLTVSLADGSRATVQTVVQALPEVTSVTPGQATPGRTLGVTVRGANFADGAVVSFGDGITVSETTVVSPSELRANVAVGPTAVFGSRDVTVTNPGGETGVLQGGFTVTAVTLGFPGKLRDRVGRSTTALAADGALDGTFTVTFAPSSGERTITALTLRTNGGGVWDTDGSTVFWALGVAPGVDAALLNTASAAVQFPVPAGGSFVLFASDAATGTAFQSGTVLTLTVRFDDGSTMTAETTVGTSLAVNGASPAQGTPGSTLELTLTGHGFAPGAAVALGPDVVVNSASVVSSTEIRAAVTILASATLGPRDVRVTNPGGESAILPGGFAVTLPPPALTLAFQGKLRDRVGRANTALAPDGVVDATLTVGLAPGSGSRTITRLELRSSTGGVWDTVGSTPYWALGAARDLDGPLLNGANAAVDVTVADGGGLVLFAADIAPSVFPTNTSLTVTVGFVDGTQASATTTVTAIPTVHAVTPAGGEPGETRDVTIDGTSFQSGATAGFGDAITVNSTTFLSATQLRANLTIAMTATPGPRDVTVTNPDGKSATLIGGFGVSPEPPVLTLAYPGMLRDRVGRSSTSFAPDGALDATLTVRIEPGSGARTVTGLELRSSTGGVWDTVAATGFWALGAAASLDGPLHNAATGAVNFAVGDGDAFALFAASPVSGAIFAPGTSLTLTATFADGSIATASVVVGASLAVSEVTPREAILGATLSVAIAGSRFADGSAVSFGPDITVDAITFVSSTQLAASVTVASHATPGPRAVTVTAPSGESATLPGAFTVTPLTMTFAGKLGDRVGQSTTALAPDGRADGIFVVQHQTGAGARTVTALRLQSSLGGVWDTDGATLFWALGAADTLEAPLLNAANASVSFTVADGGSFAIFASDASSGTAFPSGTTFVLTATFLDGTTTTSTTTVP